MLTESLNGTTFPLKQVTYYPRFYINLVLAERIANTGIYINRRNYLLEEEDGTPIYRLNPKSGIYLIK
jgi:hypothetical protein